METPATQMCSMTLICGASPETPKSKGKSMTAIKRNKVYKVRFSDAEVQKIKDANILNIAKYLRDTSLAQIDATQGNAKKRIRKTTTQK